MSDQPTRPCFICGVEFTPTGKGHQFSYCPPCRVDYRREYNERKRRTGDGRRRTACEKCGATLPSGHVRWCSGECRTTIGVHKVRECPLIPGRRLPPFYNQPEWLRVTWPRPNRYPPGTKIIRRNCSHCGRTFRGKPGERRCPQHCRKVWANQTTKHGPPKPKPPKPKPPKPNPVCCFCGLSFKPGSGHGRKYCSNVCQNLGLGRREPFTRVSTGYCRRCGKAYCQPARRNGGFCSPECRHKESKRQRRARRRAHRRAGENFTLREIADRDGWRCHICGGKVPDRDYKARDRDPTIDHLIPVAAGGEHTRANVALAHNRCNWERSDTPIEFQQRLIA